MVPFHRFTYFFIVLTRMMGDFLDGWPMKITPVQALLRHGVAPKPHIRQLQILQVGMLPQGQTEVQLNSHWEGDTTHILGAMGIQWDFPNSIKGVRLALKDVKNIGFFVTAIYFRQTRIIESYRESGTYWEFSLILDTIFGRRCLSGTNSEPISTPVYIKVFPKSNTQERLQS